jgi:hypothetical protein
MEFILHNNFIDSQCPVDIKKKSDNKLDRGQYLEQR